MTEYRVKSPERADFIKFPEPVGYQIANQNNEVTLELEEDYVEHMKRAGFKVTKVQNRRKK